LLIYFEELVSEQTELEEGGKPEGGIARETQLLL